MLYIVNPRHDGEENDTEMAIKFQALASRIILHQQLCIQTNEFAKKSCANSAECCAMGDLN